MRCDASSVDGLTKNRKCRHVTMQQTAALPICWRGESQAPTTVHGWLEDALGRYQITHIHSSVKEALKLMDAPADNDAGVGEPPSPTERGWISVEQELPQERQKV